MSGITTNVGLITGIPIQDTVDQLIQVAAQPRDLLLSRNQGLQSQQVAVNTLATRLLSLQFELGKLNVSDPYEAKTVTSLNQDVLAATLATDGNPSAGNYTFRTVQTASAQQLISQSFESLDDIQSAGVLSFGYGGFVDEGISLSELNSGAGVSRGEIKITDLAGNSATIDLTAARTVDDVIEAINDDTTTNLVASADGDSFVLTDVVGGGGTISVQEVGNGTTAADLGLTDLTINGQVATAKDVFTLHSDFKLSKLNDGNGVRISDDADEPDDLEITLADGTQAGVDLSGSTKLSDVIEAINTQQDLNGKIEAKISDDGNRLEITDLTTGGSSFKIANGVIGSAADDLGIASTVAGATITGERLVSGLKDSLLSSLNGGAGFGTLGDIEITDRNLGNATINLSSAETLDDVVDLINANSAVNVIASINSSRNGITITDDSGGSNSLVIANSGATTTADALGIAVNDAVGSVSSGGLSLQTLSEATTLESLGLTANDISITNSQGEKTSIDLNATGAEAQTIGDVIDAINAADAGVTASINTSGDGILITDTANGSSTLGISDLNGSLAEGLNLTRASATVNDTQVIDGTTSYSVDLSQIDGTDGSVYLSSVNGGDGIEYSDIKFTDSNGGEVYLDLNGEHSGVTTVQQLIDAINSEAASQSGNITASLNESGTGILITDNTGGDELVIEDVNGTAAADLKILSTDTTTDSVDGIGLFSSQDASQGALNAVADEINALEAGVTATTFFDGTGYRLSITVDETGSANEILVDVGESGFAFQETSSAQDALVVLGELSGPGSGVLLSSDTNDFNEVVEGVNLSVVSASDESVTVTVAETDEEVIDIVNDFISAYNSVRSELDTLTEFDDVALTTGLLFGTNEALRVDTELSRLLTDRYFGVGSFESLAEIGVEVGDDGKLSLDRAKLQEAFQEDPGSLKKLFTDADDGVVAKFNTAIDRLAGEDNGLLTNRNDSLQSTIDTNNSRIESLNESLDRQRERLLLQFTQLETIIANLQSNASAIDSLQPIEPLSITRSRNGT